MEAAHLRPTVGRTNVGAAPKSDVSSPFQARTTPVNEYGGGMQFVAYDARDPLDDSEDARRNPYLSRSDMRAVLARSLALYRQRNGGSIPSGS